MRVLHFFIALLLSGIVVAAPADGLTEEEARKRYPYAVVDVQVVDFGQIETGTSITARINITNEGSFDLHIAKARSSCGLMIQTWPSAPIKPGDTVPLNFRFDSNRMGAFSRIITIHTNAWHKDLLIEVTGEVVPEGGI